MIPVNVGEIRKISDLDSKHYTPIYLHGESIHVRSPRQEWTKIEWKVVNIWGNIAHIIAVAWSGEQMDYRFAYHLNMESGWVDKYSYYPIDTPVYTSKNAFEFSPSQSNHDKGSDGFRYILNLHNYFKRINDIECERAAERFAQLEMLRRMREMESAVTTLPLAGQFGDKNGKKKNQGNVPKDYEPFFDPNCEAKARLSDEDGSGRKYNFHTMEWQVRAHERHIVLKDGTVRVVKIKPQCRKRKKSVEGN